MGKQLFDDSRMFRPLESHIDRVAGFSIREMCLNGDEEMLRRTDITQPCLYIVNALHGESQLARGKSPDILAGHSLGEINALQAAGAFDLRTGLRIVGGLCQLMAQQSRGGMAAVIGLSAGKIADALALAGFHDLDVANVNSPEQVVISGP
ncbi:MAG: ACP S-malonyltransferase, partial [Hyphomicrobiales bacterium]|nr:ACP S-malonyltransferase [Hyphomicrobiales bacterium]MBV8663710.1 ACP S-malonyltransferase [Hyphomicrobiales bacterium]